MGYKRRTDTRSYKGYGYGQKKKPGLKTRLRKTGVLLILLVVGLFIWLVAPEQEEKEGERSVSEVALVQERKNIYDRSLEPLAVSFDLYAAYVKPLEVEDSSQTGEILAAALGLDRDQLIKRLSTERSFIWLGHQVPQEKVAELANQSLAGLYFQKAPVRFYPHKQTAAQVLGYVKDEQGLAGIELFYDKELRGRTLMDTGAGPGKKTFHKGKHLVLTLDLKIQNMLEKQMALLLDKTRARSVAAMAVDPATGEILASVQLPSFDPNSFWEASAQSQQVVMISKAMDTGGISGIFRYGAAIHAHREIGLPAGQASSVPLIRPRLQKSSGRARAGYWWPWSAGGFISEELAELPDPTITEAELLAFQQDLGVSCADQVDLPAKVEGECGVGRLNGVSILGAFSRLVNGGKPVALHFLKGTADSEGNFASCQFKAQGKDVAKVSAVLTKSFAASAGEKARFFGAEYLLPLAKGEEFVVESRQGNQAPEVIESSQTFDGLFVAASPAEKPDLVLLVSVQDGAFDLKAASPMRRTGDAFLRLAAKERHRDAQPDLRSRSLPSQERLLADWFAQHKVVGGEQAKAQGRVGKMPDLVGMSLRKALQQLTPCGVEVEIQGAGRVVAQEPEAGKECGARVRLRLADHHLEGQP